MEFLDDSHYFKLLDRAHAMGADVELYLQQQRLFSMKVYRGRVESMRRAIRRGLGVRLELDGRMGASCTTDLSPDGLDECLLRGLELLELSQGGDGRFLPVDVESDKNVHDRSDAGMDALDWKWRIEAASNAETAAFDFDDAVQKSEGATWRDEIETVRIMSTHGLDRSRRSSRVSLEVEVAAIRGNEERTGAHLQESRRSVGIDTREVGRRAAEKAVALLGSRQLSTMRTETVLHHEVVAELLELLAESFSARSHLLGTSLLSGRAGEMIAAPQVFLFDDPHDEEGLGSAAFDDEGSTTAKLSLISAGRLTGLLHDAHTSFKMNAGSAANGFRGDFESPVRPAFSNLILQPGTQTAEAMVSSVRWGVMVEGVMGLHLADTVSGDFSFGIVGHLIEKGELSTPLAGMTVSGNLIGLLKSISRIASDAHMHGEIFCPSVLVEGLTVSGR